MSTALLHLPENTKGRDFVVGDIHGTFYLLDRALDKVNFDPAADRIISVGDLIDRGPQSARCLEFLRQPWFFAARGNHEKYFNDVFKNGMPTSDVDKRHMKKYLQWAFNQSAADFKDMKEKLAALPLAIDVQTPKGPVGVVHADVPHGMNWQTFTEKLAADHKPTRATATEGRKRVTHQDTSGVDGIRHVFFGHTVQNGGPRSLGNCFYIDTGAYQTATYPNHGYALTLADIRATADDIKNAASKRRDACIILAPAAR